MVGLTNNRSIQDEKLIEAIFQTHHNPESRVSAGPVYGEEADVSTRYRLASMEIPGTDAGASSYKCAAVKTWSIVCIFYLSEKGVENVP